MASDGEDFDDLEALRQAALASVKSRIKSELAQLEDSPPNVKADEDEDLTALREAALRSKRVHSTLVTRNKLVVGHGPHPSQHHNQYRHNHQRHPQRHSHQQHRYGPTRKNGTWGNRGNYSWKSQGKPIKGKDYKLRRSQELVSNLELPESKNLLLPQDKWAGVQPSVSENILSTTDRNTKKRKDGKFSRYDDSESDEESLSDSDIFPVSSDPQLNKDVCSDSECLVSNQPDTRIVKHDDSKDIVIQKTVTGNSELEEEVVPADISLEIHDDKISDSLLEEYDEPLLDIQENGEIDDNTNAVNTNDKQVTDEAFPTGVMPSNSVDMEEGEGEFVGKEVLEARKKKFESTEEIKGSDLKKTISLKGIVTKSRKRHRHHRHRGEEKLSHSSHKEDLHPRDLRERNSGEVEDLRMKTSRSKDYHRRHNKYSSGSSRSSDDSCHGGSFSDSTGLPIQLKNPAPYNLGTVTNSISNRFNEPISPYRENQRRVVQERSPHQDSSRDTRYHLSDLSDSGEDNENSMFKKRCLSSVVQTSPNPKRHKSRKVLDSDQHSNWQKEHYSSDPKGKHSSQLRGWVALIDSKSKTRLTTKKDSDYHKICDNLELEEPIEKTPRINFTFEQAEEFPVPKVDDRLSVHQRLGFTSKSKLEILEKSTEKSQEKKIREKKKKKSSDPSKETELDQKILRIQEMNAAILKRQAEVKKDKERYG